MPVRDVIERAAESLFVFFDEQPSPAPLRELDADRFESFLAERSRLRGVPARGGLEENLRRLRVTAQRGGLDVLTYAGLLAFGKEPERHLPQARIHLVRFTDAAQRTYSDDRYFAGPVGAVIDAVASPGSIRIKSPGAFPPGISPEEPEHKPRNPLLTSYLYDMGYVERYGFGIARIREECDAHPLVDVVFRTATLRTEVRFEQTAQTFDLDALDSDILRHLGGTHASRAGLRRTPGRESPSGEQARPAPRDPQTHRARGPRTRDAVPTAVEPGLGPLLSLVIGCLSQF